MSKKLSFGENKEKKIDSNKGSSSSSSSSSGGSAPHKRVFTNSSFSFANLTLKVVHASKLKQKKRTAVFAKIVMGGQDVFKTHSKKAKSDQFIYDEEFTSPIDRDEIVQISLYNKSKYEEITYGKIEPIGKVKIKVTDLTRLEQEVEKVYKLRNHDTGEMKIITKLEINELKPDEVHTKIFSYPVWVKDKYNVQQKQPKKNDLDICFSTLIRYVTRWIKNMRAQVTEELRFKLIDISFFSHDKAIEILVTYSWEEKDDDDDEEENNNEEEDEEEEVDSSSIQVLQGKFFSVETKLSKKHLNIYKPTSSETYQECLDNVLQTSVDGVNAAREWIKEHPHEYSTILKFSPVHTVFGVYSVIWFYK
eukprot:TRINITY_DN44_c0_g1_i1.p1 TRINITY_DN44_c0_g1~~TRINITY_DN44_c0_g1_i1.p1  ORF type:complete len:363 (+),score=114.01 TRINITY_DN44_c0_g1_i1:35-1123(+)